MNELKTALTLDKKSIFWLVLSFLAGFLMVGGLAAWIVYSGDTDSHQRSYAPGRAITDVLLVLGMCGLPAGAISAVITAVVRRGFKTGLWRIGGRKS